MILTYLPEIICIIGLVVYVAATEGKLSEVGRICFAFGLLVSLLKLVGRG